MTQFLHSLPWTLALALASQSGESEANRVPDGALSAITESWQKPEASASLLLSEAPVRNESREPDEAQDAQGTDPLPG